MNYNIDYVLASKFKDRQWSISDSDFNKLAILDGGTPITMAQIEAADVELFAENQAVKYKQLRAKEYPAIVDQLDTIYNQGIDAWKSQIKAIKDKYPKGNM